MTISKTRIKQTGKCLCPPLGAAMKRQILSSACGDMAVTKIKPIKSTLSKALDYIQNPDKTDGKMLVSSFGCSYETADIEFGFTLAQAIDKGSNLAHHLIQSFEPGEVDYEKAHEIGKQLADAVTKGQHEYVLTTHIDKGHIHNHIIFCAVNFVDYHKYNSNKRSYYGIRNMSDKLCRETGLSVVVPGKGSKGKSYAGCPLSFRVKAVREKVMQNIKRKRREQVGKAS